MANDSEIKMIATIDDKNFLTKIMKLKQKLLSFAFDDLLISEGRKTP